MIGKLEMFKLQNPELNISVGNVFQFNEHFQELPLDLSIETVAECVYEARIALSMASKLGSNADSEDDIVQEIVTGTGELLTELGGPLPFQELMKAKKGEDDGKNEDIDLESEITED